jgi:hypothetical protein
VSINPADYLEIPIHWTRTGDGEFPYAVVMDGQRWIIRINDFPEEIFYTLLNEDREVIRFDDWPIAWHK